MNDEPLDREAIVSLLTEIGAELGARGIRGDLFVVGGAAMALAYNTRRATRDVDGVFEPKLVIYEVADEVGARHGLPPGWLNDSVKGLLPGPDPEARELLELPGLRVAVPSPQYLLALKVAAARVDRDADDIRVLAAACSLTTAQEVLDVTERILGGARPLVPKVQFLIEELFPGP